MWGVAFVGLKEVVAHGPPLTTAGARFVLGGMLLVPLARRRAREAPPPGRRRRPLARREVLLAWPMLGEPLSGRSMVGIALALAGVVTVSVRSGLGSPLGIGLMLGAALAWAF